MRRPDSRRRTFLAGLSLALAWGAAAASVSAATKAPGSKPAPKIMPISDVKPGMVLEGASVYGREGLEPFTANVIAVMPDFLGPSEDLILVRLEGKAADRYGVVSGMSGSPVYFDGKLVGAVSYRFGSFPREPIAGITPAASMLAIVKDRQNGHSRRRLASGPRVVRSAYGDARPIDSPLVCGGCPEAVLAEYGPRLEKLGFTPMRGAASAGPNHEFPLFPGGPVAAALVDGDVSIMAIGTITYIDGDEVLAFGHPFLGSGASEMPMASAEVFGTIPSLSGSAKIGRSGKVVGSLLDDRLTAIAGKLGVAPRTVPFHVVIERPGEMDARKELDFRVVDDEGNGAPLTDMAVATAIMSRVGYESIGTVHVQGKVALEDGTVLPLDHVFSGVPNKNPTFSAASYVGDVLETLWRNPFEKPRFKAVALKVAHHEQPEVGSIVRAAVEQPRVRAGETFRAQVEVRTWRHGTKRLTVEFPTARDMEPGYYSIAVVDAEEAGEIDREAGLTGFPRSFKDVIDDVRKTRRQDRLYAYLLDRVKGARVAGSPIVEMPPSMQAILGEGEEGPQARKLTRRAIRVSELNPGVVVAGKTEINVEVLAPRVD